MFSRVIVGVKELEAGRDALRLARHLTSATGNLTLAHVQVVTPRPAPDSGAAGAAARRRNTLERLAELRDESQLDAELVCAEARGVRQGLHDLARARDADLLVICASRYDVIYRDLVGDDARELLQNTPCAVAVAPVGYFSQRGSLGAIGVTYDDSAESSRVLAVAKTMARECHARLSAFQAVSGLHLRDPANFEESAADEVTRTRDRKEKLTGVQADAGYGDPAHELERFGQSVDLLVLGPNRHGRVGGLRGQGAAVRLADNPPCALLILPQAAWLSTVAVR